MKLFCDELPKCCDTCVFNDGHNWCDLTNEFVGDESCDVKRHESCPLQLLPNCQPRQNDAPDINVGTINSKLPSSYQQIKMWENLKEWCKKEKERASAEIKKSNDVGSIANHTNKYLVYRDILNIMQELEKLEMGENDGTI